jgi:hypothetical protein
MASMNWPVFLDHLQYKICHDTAFRNARTNVYRLILFTAKWKPIPPTCGPKPCGHSAS